MNANGRVLGAALLAALFGGALGEPPAATPTLTPASPEHDTVAQPRHDASDTANPASRKPVPLTRAAEWLIYAKPLCDPATLPQKDSPVVTWSGGCKDKLLDGPGTLTFATKPAAPGGVNHPPGNVPDRPSDNVQLTPADAAQDPGPNRSLLTMTAHFVRGIADGHQVIQYPDATVYEAEFHDNLPNGPVTIRSKYGVVQGIFKNDLPNGTLHFDDVNGDQTDYTYKDGVKEGPAAILWPGLLRVAFALHNGVRDGLETLTFADGSRLELSFANGASDDTATYLTASAGRYTGRMTYATVGTDTPHHIDYPPQAQADREQGTATVMLVIGEDGHVIGNKLTRSTGHPALDAAALAASRDWVYIPASIDGHAVKAVRTVNVPFVNDRPVTIWDRIFG